LRCWCSSIALALANTVRAPALPTNAEATTSPGATLRCEAEVGERTLALPVLDEPGDLAVADLEDMRSLRLDLQPASLAASRCGG
jgi:hypothetical protein